MSNQLIQDSRHNPQLFDWNGSIKADQIQIWLQTHNFKLPKDLVELWEATGGGELFETESILSPFGDPHWGDDIDSVNEFHHSKGMEQNYLVFHVGKGLTAIRLTDGCYVGLNDNYEEVSSFVTLEDWYIYEIRSEYAKHYNLTN